MQQILLIFKCTFVMYIYIYTSIGAQLVSNSSQSLHNNKKTQTKLLISQYWMCKVPVNEFVTKKQMNSNLMSPPSANADL